MIGLILVIAILGIFLWFIQGVGAPPVFVRAVWAIAAIVLLVVLVRLLTGHEISLEGFK